ncbi:MAG: DUF3301 domain-containing protein [Thalassolituus sp.]
MKPVELLLIALVGGGVPLGWAFLQRQQAARQLAMKHLKRECAREDLQLLDDTVALASLRLSLVRGRLRWRRRYSFEFSVDGSDRYHASLELLGYRPGPLELPVHRIH